jgi:hypothetical protein
MHPSLELAGCVIFCGEFGLILKKGENSDTMTSSKIKRFFDHLSLSPHTAPAS